jgi:DNA-binding NtrC family response regulator
VGDRVTDFKDTTVLVVIGDETQRQLLGWIVAEMNLPARLVPNWRAALVTTIGAPSCIIADLDDAGDNIAGAAVLRKSWGGTVPLIVLSRQPDVADKASRIGAIAGLRKPLNVGTLMGTVQRLVSRLIDALRRIHIASQAD